MNIVYVSTSSIPSRTANSIHSMRMCKALVDQGHQVWLLAKRGIKGDPFNFYGIDQSFKICYLQGAGFGVGTHYFESLLYGFLTAIFLRNLSDKIDLVYGRSPQGVYAASLLGYPVIYEVHAPPGTSLRYWLERSILTSKALKRLVTVSEALRTEYMRIYPEVLEKTNIIVAHDAAAPISVLGKGPDSWPGCRDRPQVGYIGHLYKGKGAETTVGLATRMPGVDFHLVGGTNKDISYWRSQTQERNVFFHGFVPHAMVGYYQNRFDVLLLPAKDTVNVHGNRGDVSSWMSPLKMFEYMAAGKPIVASDLPVLREVLENNVNSLLVDPNSIQEWQVALERLVADPEFAVLLANRAKLDWLQNYTWDRRATTVIDGVDLKNVW